jgi:hypothetical protein
MTTQIQVRRDTTANWNGSTVTLAEGEIGLEMETSPANGSKVNGFKIGDGATVWASLEYATLVFEHPNTVVDVDNNTLYLKGAPSQNTSKIFLIEGNGGDVLFSVKNDGTILLNEDGTGAVDFGGGYGSTGITIDSAGNLEADTSIEVGLVDTGDTEGVKIQKLSSSGKISIHALAAGASSTTAFELIHGTTQRMTIKLDGDINSAATVAAVALQAGTTVTANTAVLGGGYGSSGISTTATGNLSMNGALVVDGSVTATGGIANFKAFRFTTSSDPAVTHAVGSSGVTVTWNGGNNYWAVDTNLSGTSADNMIIVCQGIENTVTGTGAKVNIVVDRTISSNDIFAVEVWDSTNAIQLGVDTAIDEIHCMVWAGA